ncbi:MAG: PilC/PilY family type IV pilus protein [Granulosicoccus sp.]
MKTAMLLATTAKDIKYYSSALVAGFALALTVGVAPLHADDTEVFFGQMPSNSNSNPNLLFVLDTSSSMTSHDGYALDRLDRMKQALIGILEASHGVNIGIMRFNGANGGASVVYPVTSVDEEVCEDGSCGVVSLTKSIVSGEHDVAENLDTGTVTIDADFLNMDAETAHAVGLRFTDLRIPKGAFITDATLEFQAAEDGDASTNLTVQAELVGNSPAFTADSANISNRSLGSNSVTYNPHNWTSDSLYESSDIANVIQEVVNQDDWCGGNAMSLIVSSSGSRIANSYEGSGGSAPAALRISYDSTTIPSDGGCTIGSLIASVQSGDDDAEEKLSGSHSVYMNSSDLELPYDYKQQLIGVRFADIGIPANSTITSAKIEFEIDEQKNGDVSLLIKGEDTGNAQSFAGNNWELSGRPKTAQQVVWTDLPNLGKNEKLETNDLSTIVQHLVNRNDWNAGNAMAFYLKNHSSQNNKKRTVESYEGESAAAAKLYIDYQVSSGAASTSSTILAKNKMIDVVSDIRYASGTPIVDAYYEAANYYLGRPVEYGRTRGTYNQGYGDKRKPANRVSHPGSHTGSALQRLSSCTDANLGSSSCRTERIAGDANYISPMSSSCQTSNIVFLSDGGASSNSSKEKVKALIGENSCTGWGNEACGRDLAEWLKDNDHSTSLSGPQNIRTYTIGFNLDGEEYAQDFLRDMARLGGGNYNDAESAVELLNVFQDILTEVAVVDTSFTAPGATVNQYNRLTHREDIYFATFKPDSTPQWAGNLKRYKVGHEADGSGDIEIRDRNDNLAVDPDTGFFKDSAKSWWVEKDNSGAATTTPDGHTVVRGGAANQLKLNGPGDTGDRNVYTYTGDTIPTSGVDLTASAQALSENNDALTDALLDIVNTMSSNSEQAAYRTELLKWARGVDVHDSDEDGDVDDIRRQMGDPMHSRPLIVNYRNNGQDQSIVYVATNEGYLHAIDTSNGEEQFAFVPKELLPILRDNFDNSASTSHPYGLDGPMSLMLVDPNENVLIEHGSNSNEEAFLYAAMRRGGRNYYGFNVTDPDEPTLAWTIKGGSGDFAELGESWSRATPARIMFEDAARDVLIFGAGYDTNQDPSGYTLTQTADSVGRGLFIVDARTGEKIWSALGTTAGDQQFPDMDYSIPADIRVIDVDLDGFADQLYTADMGGQVWRFDMEKYHHEGDLIQSGGVIAKLNGTSEGNQRRFYSEPDVALIESNGERFMSVSIGSGWRAHPLDNIVNDRFYVIKSAAVRGAPEGYGISSGTGNSQSWTPITESDLHVVTSELNPAHNAYGWYIDLAESGEKVLGKSVTFNNKVIFSSYAPDASVEACATAVGRGYAYVLDVTSGAPALDLDDDGDVDQDDIKQPLNHGGIPPEPTILISESGEPVVLLGTEKLDAGLDNRTRRTFWSEHGPASTAEASETTEVTENDTGD